jgi:dTDP-4-amino-4,6-dideoxygalactose transaminase
MTANNSIPFLDLVTPHKELKEELTQVFNTVMDTGGFIGGPMVTGFEQDFAAYCDTRHAIGVSSGTDALRFAYMAAGIGSGDAVITVSNTFIATTEAISQAGALPIFVDVDEATYNLCPKKLREYVETQCDFDAKARKLVDRKSKKRVAAVVPVHLYGQMADMDAIQEIADQYNLIVIEDACQAHGAEYFSKKENRWRKAGSMGLAAAFSFYPGKNLGACGEGGASTTNDDEMAKKMRMLREHGQPQKYYHDIEGYNGRLDALQAGFLRVKLKQLPTWTEGRRKAAERYNDLMGDGDGKIGMPVVPSWSKPVYHLFVVRVQNREAVMKEMAAAGIGTGIHYPVPLHLQKAYENLGYKKGDLPVTEKVSLEILSLPMFPQLQAAQQQRVAETLAKLVGAKLVAPALAS